MIKIIKPFFVASFLFVLNTGAYTDELNQDQIKDCKRYRVQLEEVERKIRSSNANNRADLSAQRKRLKQKIKQQCKA